jgi:hypothetical protein
MSIELFQASAAAPRVTRNTRYEVHVYRTRTGEIVQRLPLVGTPRWESGLNLTGMWSVQVSLDERLVSKQSLRQLTESWYWSWAIVQGGSVFQAGPVTSSSYQDGNDYVTVNGMGLWALYKQKRILINAGRASVSNINAQDADFAFGPGTESEHGAPIPLARRNLSLHTIIKRLLENEQAKPGGSVPLATLPADIAGAAEREFLASQLASTGNRIFEITQVVNGPELELWPEFANTERSSIRHVATIGNTRIGRLDFPHAWSYRKALVSLGEELDGSGLVSRRWDRGAGFDRNVRTGFAEDLDGVTSGAFQQRPLLESVGQLHSDEGDADVLNGYAQADLAAGRKPILSLPIEVTMEGDAGDGKMPPSPTFDSVRNGDTGVLHVYDHPWRPDGPYYVRVLKMGSGSGPKRGRLTVEILEQP